MEKFLCQECNNQLKLKRSNFIFSFNAECCNNHKKENVDLEDLLNMKKSNQDILKCKNHKKKNIIHCFDCDEDICLYCYNNIHKEHKIEYIKNINCSPSNLYLFKNEVNNEKKVIDEFISELIQFQNRFNLYINILKKNILNYHKIRLDLINNISEKEFSYIDIKNVEEIFNNDYYKKINYSLILFKTETFIKKYEHLKNIFELMLKKGKYIEEQNIKDKYNELKNINIIPINNDYYIELIMGNRNTINLFIMKKINLSSKSFKSDVIFENHLDININKIVLKKNKNIKKLLSFFLLNKERYIHNNNYVFNIYEMTIKDLEEETINFQMKKIKLFNNDIDLLILSEDKYIIKEKRDLNLYDNLFNKQKLIDLIDFNESYITSLIINENTFVYSTYINNHQNNNKIYIINIDDKFVDKYILNNCGEYFINFYENKKILFSYDNYYLYLINFKTVIPEVIQKIEIIKNNERIYNKSICDVSYLLQLLDNFNDDSSIYIKITQSNILVDCTFYFITYLIQFKIIEGELREISKIEIERKRKENCDI